jgi:hypothetical protein
MCNHDDDRPQHQVSDRARSQFAERMRSSGRPGDASLYSISG